MKGITLIFLAFLVLAIACGQSNPTENTTTENEKEKVEDMEMTFSPDSSISSKIYLHNPSSTRENLGDIMSMVDANKDLPDAFFKSGEEYLQVIVFPGNETNSISQFVVGYSSNLPKSEKLNPLEITSLQTESGVELGMIKKDLISIKGSSYKEEMVDGQQRLSYEINESTSSFLNRYNMPVYIAEYWFKDDKLYKYKFGFEYP